MDTYKVDSLADFINFTEILDLVSDLIIFRGQSNKGSLLPGIARKNPNLNTIDREKEVIDQLELQGSSMIEAHIKTKLDLLVLAQHFGLKTRLLDWTRNPLIALWFACSDDKPGDAYIYALNAETLLEKNVYSNDPFKTTKTRVFQPRLNNDRIKAQDGWFTLHKYSTKANKFVPLEVNRDVKDHLFECVIKEKNRAQIIQSLDRLGISAKTIFPDLTGLCKHLNNKHQLA